MADVTLIGPRFVIWSEITNRSDNSFLPKGLNEYFFWENHNLQVGDRVKITIQKVEAQCPPSPPTPPEASSSS